MSCWVVPAIAAELWGVPLAQVMARVADGSVPSQREHGFLFVDVAAWGHSRQTTRRPDGPPPPTFVPVTRDADDHFDRIIAEELGGVVQATADESTPFPPGDWTAAWSDDAFPPLEDTQPADVLPPDPVLDAPDLASSVTVEEDPELPPLCDEEDEKPIAHWRQRRRTVARTRRPPVVVQASSLRS
jgi:hypothetical protein